MSAIASTPVPWGRVAISRGAGSSLFHLITPENRMPSRLPWFGMPVTATLLVTPRGRRCEFAEVLLATEQDTRSAPIAAGAEHIFYVLSGSATVTDAFSLPGPGAYAYVSPTESVELELTAGTSLLWIARPWVARPSGFVPESFASRRESLEALPVGPPGVEVRELIPRELAFDLAVNLMSFEAGAALDRVEIHDEDHGLYLVTGQGSYLLGTERFPVDAGDFIYMAPYCPQHFVATGDGPAEYLIYKPANRLPGVL